jgi:hypothetical protein
MLSFSQNARYGKDEETQLGVTGARQPDFTAF